MGKRQSFILISVLGCFLVIAAATSVLFFTKKKVAAYECKVGNNSGFSRGETNVEILQVGSEFIITFSSPRGLHKAKSFLVSEMTNIPNQWKAKTAFGGLNRSEVYSGKSILKSTLPSGFEYINSLSKESSFWTSIKFSTKGTEEDKTPNLTIIKAQKTMPPSVTKCKSIPINQYFERPSIFAYDIPIQYLKERQKYFDFMNPKLGDIPFNTRLASYLTDINGSEYSIYRLLADLPKDKLTTSQIDLIEQSKKKLVAASSDEVRIWVFSNNFTYQSQWGTEDSARQLCQRFSENIHYYTSRGYEIISSAPDHRDQGNGVNCKGDLNLLKKEGYIEQ